MFAHASSSALRTKLRPMPFGVSACQEKNTVAAMPAVTLGRCEGCPPDPASRRQTGASAASGSETEAACTGGKGASSHRSHPHHKECHRAAAHAPANGGDVGQPS